MDFDNHQSALHDLGQNYDHMNSRRVNNFFTFDSFAHSKTIDVPNTLL